MLQALRCPPGGWDYDAKDKEKRERILKRRCERLLRSMRRPESGLFGKFPFLAYACDTRPVHRKMFRWMTPLCFPSFAGNYRGDARYRCLKNYNVEIKGDELVGCPAELVGGTMSKLGEALRAFEEQLNAQEGRLSAQERFAYVIHLVCDVLSEFLRIHPYANGNGHMGRFIVWALLLRFGYVPRSWPMEERPPEPGYSTSLWYWRRGQKAPLVHYMIACVNGGFAISP